MGDSSWLGTERPRWPWGCTSFYVSVCARAESVCEQKSKEPERVHVERAEREEGVYGEELFEKRAHNHGYVFIHMWICRRRDQLVH